MTSQRRESALASLKILDFTQLLPGPFCSLLLADLGADVIKVEHPNRGDGLRWLPFLNGGANLAFAYLNRNKRSLTLDLKEEESIQIIHKLIQNYDVIIEGFRPGVMKRFGLDYDRLSRVQPRLIYCSISGYGQTGPLASRAGHDINYIARSGVASVTGTKESVPIIPGVQLADLTGAHQAAIGILAAVIHRNQTDEGQQIDISLTDSAFSLLSIHAAVAMNHGENSQMGNMPLTGRFPVYRFYRCADDRYLAVGALETPFQRQLAEALKVPLDHDNLETCFLSKTRDEWCQYLQNKEVCVEPILTLQEVLVDPQILARNMVIEVSGLKQPGNPIHFTGSSARIHKKAPKLGEHTKIILDSLEGNE